ncbi:hypothetical protein C8Q80DRAFT_256260 [Daedaleopsis nitida]|nr:hypothetical protein C8Q80DRAFT_256260 [Daedaleopsis nitida]
MYSDCYSKVSGCPSLRRAGLNSVIPSPLYADALAVGTTGMEGVATAGVEDVGTARTLEGAAGGAGPDDADTIATDVDAARDGAVRGTEGRDTGVSLSLPAGALTDGAGPASTAVGAAGRVDVSTVVAGTAARGDELGRAGGEWPLVASMGEGAVGEGAASVGRDDVTPTDAEGAARDAGFDGMTVPAGLDGTADVGSVVEEGAGTDGLAKTGRPGTFGVRVFSAGAVIDAVEGVLSAGMSGVTVVVIVTTLSVCVGTRSEEVTTTEGSWPRSTGRAEICRG